MIRVRATLRIATFLGLTLLLAGFVAVAGTMDVPQRPAARSPLPAVRPKTTVASRPSVPAQAAPTSVPPDVVMLADLEDLYEPVPFDHQGHVRMADMSAGCTYCHHHTAEGTRPAACRSCHATAPARETTAMPGLKGAYHRQCLSCHVEWSHDTACSACHVPKAQRGVARDRDELPSVIQLVSRMSKPVKQKDLFVYQTRHSSLPVVSFHHRDHAQSFGLNCADCHQGGSCASCHSDASARSESAAARHGVKDRCLSCHNETNCASCHDRAERPPFDHAVRSGWPLGPHHDKLTCSECHGSPKEFTVPSQSCHGCHAQTRSRTGTGGSAEQGGLARVHESRPPGSEQPDRMDCLACHSDVARRFEHATTVHGPAAEAAGCRTCHDVNAANSPRPAADRQRELCVKCHDRSLDAGNGRSIVNVSALLGENRNRHGPVREGNCSACHNPHASGNAHLLVRAYTPDFYAPFDLNQYSLCYGCHNKEQVLSESASGLTGFRNKDRNLHWLHVNREKGRTCRVCHEVHASNRPFHIRESVPFSGSGWQLPINYEKTDAGGRCAPGCHAPMTYNRT